MRTAKGFAPSDDAKFVAITSRLILRRALTAYIKAIGEHARGRLLDLGCGNVPYYEIYAPLVDETICVDWEKSFHRNEFLDLTADLNEPLPIPDRSFDTVLLTDVLEHIAKPESLICEVSRLLKPDGRAIIGVPFLFGLHEEPFDFFRYTEFSIKRLCEQAGLIVLSLEPYGGAPEVLMDTFGKMLTCIRVGRPFLSFYASFCSLVERLSITRRLSRSSASELPLGYCIVARSS